MTTARLWRRSYKKPAAGAFAPAAGFHSSSLIIWLRQDKYVELRIYPTYFCVDAKTARGRVPLAVMAERRYSLFTAAQILRRWFSVLTQTVTQTRKIR